MPVCKRDLTLVAEQRTGQQLVGRRLRQRLHRTAFTGTASSSLGPGLVIHCVK